MLLLFEMTNFVDALFPTSDFISIIHVILKLQTIILLHVFIVIS